MARWVSCFAGQRTAIYSVHMAAMRGMDVVVLRPEGFALPPAIMQKAAAAAAAAGGSISETNDRDEALTGAHVVYAKEWGSTSHYGNAEIDARQRTSTFGYRWDHG